VSELTATLIIGRYQSTCSRCHRGTLMSTSHHTRELGYGVPAGKRGCGARFVDTATSDIGYTAKTLRELRPDLPVGDPLHRTH